MRASKRAAVALAVGVSLVAIPGCGGSEAGLTSVQQARLQSSISEARRAAKAKDRTAVRAALNQFRSDVSALERDGALSREVASRMRETAAAALRRAAVEVPAPAPRPALETPQGPEEGEGEKPEEGKGGKGAKGKGKAKKKGGG